MSFKLKIPLTDAKEIISFLNSKISVFNDNPENDISIDLSEITVLTSNAIGQLAMLIQAARKRGGKVAIFVPNTTTYEILDIVNFSCLAELIQDKKEFEEFFIKKQKPKPKPEQVKQKAIITDKKKPAKSHLNNKSKSNKNAKNSFLFFEKKSVQITICIIISFLFLLSSYLIVFTIMQYKLLQDAMHNTIVIENIMKSKSDSLTQEIQHCREEYRIYMDVE